MKRKRWPRILVPAALAAALGGAAFSLSRSRAAAPAEFQMETLALGDVESLVSASGTINPHLSVEVSSQVSGKITKIYADFNSPVGAGQVMAELDQESLRQQVESCRVSLLSAQAGLDSAGIERDLAKKKYERTLDLYRHNLVSQEDMEDAEVASIEAQSAVRIAEGAVAQARSALETSRVNLSYAVIRTPIAGVVLERDVNLGQTVAAGYQAPVLFKVASSLKTMEIQCNVDEADIGRIAEGQRVSFTVSALPEAVFLGAIRQVRLASSTTSSVVTYTVIIDAENPDLLLRPGMTATASIVAAQARNVLRVSNAALRFTPTGLTADQAAQAAGLRASLGPKDGLVWTVDPSGALRPRAVREGLAGTTHTEIAGGDLSAGAKIVAGLKSAASAASTTNPDMPPPPPEGFGGPPPGPPPIR